MLNKEKKSFLDEVFGVGFADKLEVEELAKSKAIEELGIAYKASSKKEMSLNVLQAQIQSILDAGDSALFPDADSTVVREIFADRAVVDVDGTLYQVGFTVSGATVTLGTPKQVQGSYEPVSSAKAQDNPLHPLSLARRVGKGAPMAAKSTVKPSDNPSHPLSTGRMVGKSGQKAVSSTPFDRFLDGAKLSNVANRQSKGARR